MQYEDQ